MLRKDLSHSALTDQIIGIAIEIHRELGPGFVEAIYEEAFCVALEEAGIPFERQKPVDVQYHGRVIGQHRLDLYVAGCVVVELKAIRRLEDIHFAVVRSYMKALGTDAGLLLNFAEIPLRIRRVSREWFPSTGTPHYDLR